MADENEINEEKEFYEHHRFTVDKGQGLLRIDKFIMSRLENASRNKIQQSAKAGNILVNDKAVKSNYRIKPDDVISIVMSHPPREIEIIAEDIPLNIVYEDADIIIVNKQPGMVVHPAYGNYKGTLLNALKYHLQKDVDNKSEAALVHRIDKNTSGLLIVAKNELAQTKLAKEFFYHTIDRIYYALAWGDLKEDAGTITGHVGRSLKDRKVMKVFPEGDYGKHAVTHYKVSASVGSIISGFSPVDIDSKNVSKGINNVLGGNKVIERFGYVTLVECKLETGRTHQIRAHFRYIGHPLFNDDTYGGDQIIKGTTFTKYKQFINNCFSLVPRQALHAKSIGFIHPGTGERIDGSIN